MPDSVHLNHGYNAGLPADCTWAWGCRAIVTQNGNVDIMWDRTDCSSTKTEQERQEILGRLSSECTGSKLVHQTRTALTERRLDTRGHAEVELHRGKRFVIKANCNASAGYCYIAAYLVEDES